MKIKLDNGAKAPTRAHELDAGYDLYARYFECVPAGGSALFDPEAGLEDILLDIFGEERGFIAPGDACEKKIRTKRSFFRWKILNRRLEHRPLGKLSWRSHLKDGLRGSGNPSMRVHVFFTLSMGKQLRVLFRKAPHFKDIFSNTRRV